jgi:hypothetical protein
MAETLDEKLTKIDQLERELVRKLAGAIASGDDMYLSHMLIMGAVKRTLAFGEGFRLLIRERNFPSAAPFVRMQLDTALRVYAATLVSNPEAYAGAVLHGERIDRMRDRQGKRMRDAYLVEKLAELYPWVSKVYAETSGLVHFTSRHIFAGVRKVDDAHRTVHFLIGAKDPPRPDEDYFEVLDCFFEAMRITAILICGWAYARRAA